MAIMQSNALRAQLKAGLNAALSRLKPLMLLLRTAVLHEPSTVLTGEHVSSAVSWTSRTTRSYKEPITSDARRLQVTHI